MQKPIKPIRFFLIFLPLIIANITYSQIGIGTTDFSSGAIVDISSVSKEVPKPFRKRLNNIAPGTHTFQIVAHTYAGTGKSYRFQFANTKHERFQILVKR